MNTPSHDSSIDTVKAPIDRKRELAETREERTARYEEEEELEEERRGRKANASRQAKRAFKQWYVRADESPSHLKVSVR